MSVVLGKAEASCKGIARLLVECLLPTAENVVFGSCVDVALEVSDSQRDGGRVAG